MAYFHGIHVIEVSGLIGDSGGGAPAFDFLRPGILSPLAGTTMEGVAHSITLAAGEPVTFAKRPGADGDAFTLAGAVLTLPGTASGKALFTVNLRAADGSGNVTDFTYSVTRQPSAAQPSIAISPTASRAEGQTGVTGFEWTLTLTRNGNPDALPYSWIVEGVTANAADFGGALPAGTGTFAPGETVKTITVLVAGDPTVEPDETFRVVATLTGYNSATGTGTIVNDDVAPTPPVNSVAPAITGTAQEGQILTASTGTWSNTPTAFAWQWKRGGADIAGAVNATRTLVAADIGAVMSVTVTATNASGSASATSAATAAVIAAAIPVPANTVAPAIAGTATVGSVLTTGTGTWSNTPTSFAYQWRRDGVDIAGAVASTYTLVAADGGRSITCRVVATNAGGSASATSNAVAVAAQPTVTLSAGVSKAEGNSGATLYTYTATRSITAGAIAVAWSFAPGSTSAADYTGGTLPAGGSLAFADGAATASFSISVAGDTTVEPDEQFTVSIAAPAGYAAGAAMAATGTILNDDAAAPVIPAGRVAVITTFSTKPVTTPQLYNDRVLADSTDAKTHPHIMASTHTHTALRSGFFDDPTLWDTGTVPTGDAVVNFGAYDVTIRKGARFKDLLVGGRGTLRIDPAEDMLINCDTLMVHGTTIIGEPGNPIPESATSGKPRLDIVFEAREAPLDTTRLGLMTMGPVRIQGAVKKGRLEASATVPAGAKSAVFPGLQTSGWRVGDRMVFLNTQRFASKAADPQYTGPAKFYGTVNESTTRVITNTEFDAFGFVDPKEEERVIATIVGETVTWVDALQYEHRLVTDILPQGQVVTIRPPVTNLSRSIRFRSADPTARQKRGHTMFMFHDDIQVRHAECVDMGRTDTDPSLLSPTQSGVAGTNIIAYDAASGGVKVTDELNVRGRYPLHLHGTGAFASRRMAVIEGCSVWGSNLPVPGWGITHHSCRAAIEGNVVHNVRGAGIVSENGDETGQWIDNTVSYARGDGFGLSWGGRAERWENHNGHAGIGYDNQARQVLCHGNIAADCNIAWMYLQQNTNLAKRYVEFTALRLFDPFAWSRANEYSYAGSTYLPIDSYDIEQAQIPDFDDNVSFACRWGFGVSHRQFTDRADSTPMIAKRNHCVGVLFPFMLINYSNTYAFYDFLWYDGETGGQLGPVSWHFNFVNYKIRKFAREFVDAGNGINYDGFWIDGVSEEVTESYLPTNGGVLEMQAADYGGTDIAQHPAYGVMGPWTAQADSVRGNKVAKVREWKPIPSSSLPVPYPAAPVGLGGVEPSPGTAKPYFYLDPASLTTLDGSTTNRGTSMRIKGVIVDRVGVRRYGDTQNPETRLTLIGPKAPRVPGYRRPQQYVEHFGCFQDGTTWKSRLWHANYDRLTGEYFTFYVDITLVNFDPAFLAANVVDPNATRPSLPLKPEALPAGPIAPNTTPPAIMLPASINVAENLPLAQIVRIDNGQARLAVDGGADAAMFEVALVAGAYRLRWKNNVPGDYETMVDANGDHVFEVRLRATDPFGNVGTATTQVRLIDKTEGVVSPFSDSLVRADPAYAALDSGADWTRLSVTPETLGIRNGALVLGPTPAGDIGLYAAPDTGSTSHYAQGTTNGYSDGARLAVAVVDGANFVWAQHIGENVRIWTVRNGVEAFHTNFALSPAKPTARFTLRVEYRDGGAVRILINGTLVGEVTIAGQPAGGRRAGISVAASLNGAASAALRDFQSGAL